MITRTDRNNQVTPDTLEQRESERVPARHKDTSELDEVKAKLAAIQARIGQASAIQPQPHERHCLDCFQKGRNAAIRLILGE